MIPASRATVRATIAGNAPQPPALAFLRAGRVRARPAVPRPCKAVLRALQASVNPARIPATVCNRSTVANMERGDLSGDRVPVIPATSNAASVRACQRFDRRQGFRQAVANAPQPFRPVSNQRKPSGNLSGKPWRFDVRRLSAVRKSAPDSAATVCRIPASVRRPSAACQRFDRPRRIRRQPIRQAVRAADFPRLYSMRKHETRKT